ncbi:MAG: hypothetical protein IJC07_03200 [Clostridia bacterium]|nr:hypothetical protein [Clostridia bacterium]
MDKLYGYKQSDVIGLAEFLKERKGESLSQTFSQYALKSGKAKGTVRNLYYALAKLSKENEEFRNQFLGGEQILVNQIVEFDSDQERALIKQVLIKTNQGKSVRSAINELAEGDQKVALRYQNKYRSAIKTKPQLIEDIIEEMKRDGTKVKEYKSEKALVPIIKEEQFLRLKSEINNLVLRISQKERKENEFLKDRIRILEQENLRLKNLLYKDGINPTTPKFFRFNKGEDLPN